MDGRNPQTESFSLDREDTLLSYRATAVRYAYHFAARWRIVEDEDELHSLADLALCEAGRTFRPDRSTRFSTYLFLHVRRLLHDVIRFRMREAGWKTGLD